MESRQNTGIVINRALNRLIPLAEKLTELEVPFLGEISAGFPSEVFRRYFFCKKVYLCKKIHFVLHFEI